MNRSIVADFNIISYILRRPENFEKISLLVLTLVNNIRNKREISSNYMAFLENLNFRLIK